VAPDLVIWVHEVIEPVAWNVVSVCAVVVAQYATLKAAHHPTSMAIGTWLLVLHNHLPHGGRATGSVNTNPKQGRITGPPGNVALNGGSIDNDSGAADARNPDHRRRTCHVIGTTRDYRSTKQNKKEFLRAH
jgi:hypothetical protein